MTSLPDVMNVNWYITCTSCEHHRFIDVEWFKATRADFGKGRPLTWSRLVCKKCKGRRISLSRKLPEASEQYAKHLKDEAEREAQSDFNAKQAQRSGYEYTHDEDPFVDDTGWHLPPEVDGDEVPIDDSYETP